MSAATRTRRGARGGVDLGGTKIEAIVVDARNNVLGAARRPTPTQGTPSDVAAGILEAVRDAAQSAGIGTASLQGVGVGSPGIVDEATGAVTSAGNLPGWAGRFELGPALMAELGTPVFVSNDVRVATEAEFRLGAGRPYRSVLGVFWGTGVGGGLILNGKSWVGRGGAGEIGHTVVKLDGARCPCGRRGCLEAYAGRAAMEARARRRVDRGRRTDLFHLMEERGRTRLTSSIWGHALERGDKLATEILNEAVEALGAGIASAINLLDVEAVIIGGGLGVRFGESYAQRIDRAMQPHLFHDEHPPEVKVAALGDLGGAIGAALVVGRARRAMTAGAASTS
jgi:glucokinase